MCRIANPKRKTLICVAVTAFLAATVGGCSKGERMAARPKTQAEDAAHRPIGDQDPEFDPMESHANEDAAESMSSEEMTFGTPVETAREVTIAEQANEVEASAEESAVSSSPSGFVFPPQASSTSKSRDSTSSAQLADHATPTLATDMNRETAVTGSSVSKIQSMQSRTMHVTSSGRSANRRMSSTAINLQGDAVAEQDIRPSVANTARVGVVRDNVSTQTRAGSMAIKSIASEEAANPAVPMVSANSETDPAEISVESMAIENLPPEVTVATNPRPQASGEHLSHLPAGSIHDADAGYTKVQIFYATDRERGHLPLSSYQLAGHRRAFLGLGGAAILLIALAGFGTLRGKSHMGGMSAVAGGVCGCLAGGLVFFGHSHVEKHGVTYTGDRGQLTRGIAEVTIPDSHSTGMVERPSLLQFEVREDQRKHVVLTSAVELLEDDFDRRLSDAVASSADGDMLVFIHGYNVSFESALLRTAQISVDLPFEGVPVCYSWPSQGTLLGYPVDANNAEWTVHHLQQFLLDLAEKSGAKSINVVAHSMGNRAMTAAMQQISWDLEANAPRPFDRIVLAAPDVDADRFRRDFAPALVNVANQVTLYASSDDQALVASKQVNGYPRAGDGGENIVVVPGVETIDVSGIDLSLLGHSYYGDNESMLRDLYDVVRARLPATQRPSLIERNAGPLTYWQLAHRPNGQNR